MPKRQRHAMGVIAVFTLALAPHAGTLPVWVVVWCLVLWAWALVIDATGRRPPPAWLRYTLMVLGLSTAVAGYFPYALWRLEFAASALAVLLGIKSLELTSHRSRMASLYLAHFLVVAKVLDTLTLEMGLYALAVIMATTAAMVRLNSPLSRTASLVSAGGLMLAALPLAAALFLFFPRAEGGPSWRWGLGRGTGFSETLSPGDLTALARNESPAFRAAFDGPVPRPEQRYWRGVVLWNFDGRTWRRGAGGSFRTSPVQAGSTLAYTLTMEPHWRPWVFALDAPVEAPPGIRLHADLVLGARGRIGSRRTFSLRSALEWDTGPALPSDQRALRLPQGAAPQATALGRSWAEAGLTPPQALAAAMAMLGNGDFSYDAEPPAVDGDPTDGFLFGTRSGYCGHYASATALLLRAAGVPARVVVGYQGGEANPLGGFLTVRQSDAHAWCEVLLPGRGWVRVDPTTAVAPARATAGARALLGEAPEEAADGWQWGAWATELSMAWDAVRFHMDPWVTDLSPDIQDGLLARLGISEPGPMARLAALALALVLAAALAWFMAAWRPWRLLNRGPSSTARRALALYDRYRARLERAGLEPRPWQGPMDLAESVAGQRPELAGPAREVARCYAGLRYGQAGAGELARLRRLVRSFRP